MSLYGILARTEAARAELREGRWRLPPGFVQDPARWWCDVSVGLLLCDASTRHQEGECSVSVLIGDALPAAGMELGAADRVDLRAADAVHGLRGAFACANWEPSRRRLTLQRDHFGQREIFVRDDGDRLLFCSELPPLLDDPHYVRRLDLESAVHFLLFGRPVLGRTLAAGVASIPAGHALVWSPGCAPIVQRRYTPLAGEARKVADPAWRAHIAAVLDEAILARDDDNAALLLSGGVDSSYIAATCASMRRAGGRTAYTIEFVDGDIENETPYAALAASAAGLRHVVVPMTHTDAARSLDQILAAAHPCSAWAAATHHHLCTRIAADGHRRLLSGLGADEIFGGYSQYLQAYRRLRKRALSWPDALGVDAFDALGWEPALAAERMFAGVPRFFDAKARREGLHPPFARWNHAPHLIAFYRECRAIKPDAHLFEMMVAHECQHRVPDLLLRGFEQIALAEGIVTRYPFLDPELGRLACALGASERFWLSGGRWKNKRLLRRIALDRLPTELITRRPVSYNAPIRRWLADPAVGGPILEATRSSAFWELSLVRREWFERLLVGIGDADAVCSPLAIEQIWILIVLCAWYD
ncbi:MAG: hypothetical protein E6Q88_01520, partial [Lysobacteraceae bacterium]